MDPRIVGDEHGPGAPIVVLLHGFSGSGTELAPFARSLSAPARFVFPDGPIDLSTMGLPGRAWWPIDTAARDQAMASKKPRDLSSWVPPELPSARARVSALLEEALARHGPAPLVLGGFSQGAMLACDVALRSKRALAGLVLFSPARIAGDEWAPLLGALRGTPIVISHGREDWDLSFAAAEAFKDDLCAAGCEVRWVPFDGGHEVPLVAWRQLRKLLRELAHGAAAPHPPTPSPLAERGQGGEVGRSSGQVDILRSKL
jgi:phospholipase/carboxylesterase